jgi:serine/threonine protein kinase
MTQKGFTELTRLMDGTQMEVPLFLHIAIALAKLVHSAHTRNSIIRYLNPAGIRVDPETKMAIFGENRRPDYAYLSPEQTGRMNDPPDERADLYALGVMYYQMLAGQLPLQAHNTEAWAHAHLAIMPRPLQELRPDLTGPLNDIVMKLLAKAPEHRYQSAHGLLSDLNRCASLLQDKGGIVSFDIGRIDDAGRFRLPRTLHATK